MSKDYKLEKLPEHSQAKLQHTTEELPSINGITILLTHSQDRSLYFLHNYLRKQFKNQLHQLYYRDTMMIGPQGTHCLRYGKVGI